MVEVSQNELKLMSERAHLQQELILKDNELSKCRIYLLFLSTFLYTSITVAAVAIMDVNKLLS